MSGSVREALPHVQKWSGVPLGDQEACLDVWEWLEGPPRCLGVVGSLSRMSGSGRESLPDVLKWSGVSPDVREWSGGPPGCPGGVGSLPDVREWSGGLPGCPGVVVSPLRMSGSVRE